MADTNIDTDIDTLAESLGGILIMNATNRNTVSEMEDRPTFFFQFGKYINAVRAAGIIPYYIDDKGVHLLMIRCNGRLEDFGGKTDPCDEQIEDTAIREALEESNGVLKKYDVKKVFKDPVRVYQKKGRYMTYLIETNKMYNPTEFGNKEYHDGINRTVEYITLKTFDDIHDVYENGQWHPRLVSHFMVIQLKKLILKSTAKRRNCVYNSNQHKQNNQNKRQWRRTVKRKQKQNQKPKHQS